MNACRRAWLLLALIGAVPSARAERVLYVSPAGDDSWTGRLAAPDAGHTDGPFATLSRARDEIRRVKGEAVTVRIRGGVYRLSEPLTLTPDDSGTRGSPISYVAWGNEDPVLSGGRVITGWRPWKGKIQCVSLPEVKAGKWYFRSLFADGERQARACYPNVDPTDPRRKGFLYIRRGIERRTVGGMHNRGDTLDYEVEVPFAGDYAVWLRYGHNMEALGTLDMGGHSSLSVDGGEPVPLLNLPDTGGWGTYRWSHAGNVTVTAGRHALRWRNDQGGGYGLAAIVLTDDPAWTPMEAETPPAAAGKHLVALDPMAFAHANAPQLGFGVTGADAMPKGEKHTFPYGPGDVKPSWGGAPDAEVHIWPAAEACRGYKQITHLESIDEQARTITLSGPECVTQLGIGDRYFVENVLEELDSPGEWYLDPQAGVVYYWPKRPLSKAEITAPVTGRLIEFEGDETKGQTLRNVRFSGLTFTQTDYSPDDGCVGYSTGNNGVVYLRGAVGCAIENCRFVSNGKNAVYLDGGRENVIAGNDISASAEGGICLRGSSANTISDNHIHDLGAVYKHVGGVVTGGSDNVVSHNLIHDTPRWAITLGATGTGTVVEYNEVYNTSLETYDTGGIMAYQDDRQFNCQATIRHNLVHDGVGYSSMLGNPMFDSRGIYIDGFSSGYTITHNICYRNSANGGIFVQGGHDIRISNNISVANGGVQYMHANFMENGGNIEFTRNILCGLDPRTALMWVFNGGEKVTRFDHNLYSHPTGEICYPVAGAFAQWQALGQDAHSVVGDPGFVDAQAGNYSLRPDSPALQLGFEPIDVSKIGLLHRRCQCHSPRAQWGVSR